MESSYASDNLNVKIYTRATLPSSVPFLKMRNEYEADVHHACAIDDRLNS